MEQTTELEQYPELESETEEEVNEVDARPVSSQPNDWNVRTLREKYDRGLINLQPDYQREYVWGTKPDLQSRLIESLILRIPVPPLYFMELMDGKIEVVDGQQRLTTLIKFVTNDFPLSKLQKLSSLNNKYFKDLTIGQQEKILDASIRSIVINAGSNHNLRYEIFERLNRGAVSLKEQEIRNCAYRGPFCDLLTELEMDSNWRNVKGTDTPEPRFKEREMILRFFALTNRIDYYTGNLKKFLNDYMGEYAPNDVPQVNELGSLFRKTMQNVYLTFGDKSGKLFTIEEDEPFTSGKWEKKFSISALDIQASALIGYSPSKVKAAAHTIRESYKFFLVTNPQVRAAISRRPSAKVATQTRWFDFKVVVKEIMNNIDSSSSSAEPLADAKALYKAGYFTAAGAVAGVALEGHLKKLCTHHKIALPSKATIGPLINLLKKEGVYDQTQGRRVEVLMDIRNRCDHFVSNPPNDKEVWEIIDGTETLMRSFPTS